MNGCKFFFLGCFWASESEKEADGPGNCQPCIDRAAPLRIPVPPRGPFHLRASVLHRQSGCHTDALSRLVPVRSPLLPYFGRGACVFLRTAGKAPLFQAPLQLGVAMRPDPPVKCQQGLLGLWEAPKHPSACTWSWCQTTCAFIYFIQSLQSHAL